MFVGGSVRLLEHLGSISCTNPQNHRLLHHRVSCFGLYSFTGPKTCSMHCGSRTFTSSLIRPNEVMADRTAGPTGAV